MDSKIEKPVVNQLLIETCETSAVSAKALREREQCVLRLTNLGPHAIAWLAVTTNWRLLDVYPPCGLLRPSESIYAHVCRELVGGRKEGETHDSISVEWIKVDDGLTEFDRSLFDGNVTLQRQSIVIRYNV
uniref:Major sperm protein n=1 Tax=Trichuris muris TaxID=70415 RepID=A0A5S6Q485_TRIMR